MSFELPTQRTQTAAPTRWPGMAFLVEALLLLVFVTASFAVFTYLFATSSESANESKNLTDAVALASTTAERFAAEPTSVEGEFIEGGLRVVCDVRPEERPGGTMYHATISVSRSDSADGSSPIYEIQTSKYESGV